MQNKKIPVRIKWRFKILLPIIVITMTLNAGCNSKNADPVDTTSEESADNDKTREQNKRTSREETAADSRNIHSNKDLELHNTDKSNEKINDATKAIEAAQPQMRGYYPEGLSDESLSDNE